MQARLLCDSFHILFVAEATDPAAITPETPIGNRTLRLSRLDKGRAVPLTPALALTGSKCQLQALLIPIHLMRETKMKFRPLHDRVVVKRVQEETKTKGGIIIPDTAAEKPQQGEVIAVGPGSRGENGEIAPMGVKAGDKVLFGKWSGTEVKIDGEDLVIMKESDIMGVLA
jgi:chaperonin GroES